MKGIVIFLSAVFVCNAGTTRYKFDQRNVITVPPNCGPGQQLINGVCTDIWIKKNVLDNTVTVPPNCLPEQEFINGRCNDVWASEIIIVEGENSRPRNVVDIPNHCPLGYQPDALGVCRPVWK